MSAPSTTGFRERPPTPAAADGLAILLVGELAYNPERVLALEERGHRLYGLRTDHELGSHTVAPLPFGHVTDLDGHDAHEAHDAHDTHDGHDAHDWRHAVESLRPDVIYALLNWRAIPLAMRCWRRSSRSRSCGT